jgi:creatinine amidohydrolase/Fe(II)-dependent formamide hydrolase-like protein
MRPTRWAVTLCCVLACAPAVLRAQGAPASPGRDMGGGRCAQNAYNCADAPNPVPTPNTVWLEELTWMDIRDAIRAGKRTIIIPTGGVEPNGPWLASGKHNYVLHQTCEAIARQLGDALCAPIVKFVPEGAIEPPSGHMTSPGTISTRESTFRALLTDIAASLKQHGFTNIILIGDSGGNQGGQKAVADSLTTVWKGTPVIAHIPEYYEYAKVAEHMKTRGVPEGKSDNLHDDPIITMIMLLDDPRSVRYEERQKIGALTINGHSIADRQRSLAQAKEIVAYRSARTVDAIRAAIANRGTLPVQPR